MGDGGWKTGVGGVHIVGRCWWVLSILVIKNVIIELQLLSEKKRGGKEPSGSNVLFVREISIRLAHVLMRNV